MAGYKILGQEVADSSGIEVYKVPDGMEAVISTLTVSNDTEQTNTFTIYFVKAGDEVPARKNKMHSEVPIPPNEVYAATIGITLAAGDFVWAVSDDEVIVHCYGREERLK